MFIAIRERGIEDTKFWSGTGWTTNEEKAAVYASKRELRDDLAKRRAGVRVVRVDDGSDDRYPELPY